MKAPAVEPNKKAVKAKLILIVFPKLIFIVNP
jgi:hypothetical protein